MNKERIKIINEIIVRVATDNNLNNDHAALSNNSWVIYAPTGVELEEPLGSMNPSYGVVRRAVRFRFPTSRFRRHQVPDVVPDVIRSPMTSSDAETDSMRMIKSRTLFVIFSFHTA